MEEKPKVEWDSESETYKIIVGDLWIFIEHLSEEKFNWYHTNENMIHQDRITSREKLPED